MRSSRAVGIAAAFLSVYPSIRLSAQTIDTIVVVNHSIFDSESDAPGLLARLANRLHVTTRAGVIRRTLLVNPGDRYDSARVAESERALRALFVFSRVRLDTIRIAGRLALRVTTSDGWSTKPQLGYSSAGGDATWLAGLVEENVLGTATALSAVYNKTPDRTILDFRHVNPHFFGRRTRLAAEYASKSGAKHVSWFVRRPFFETWAARAVASGHVRYHVHERFNSYARREDVDLSQLLHAGVCAASRAWGYPSDRAGVGAELSGQASAIWSGGFVVLRGAANGVYAPGAGGIDSGRVSGGITVASQNLRRQTLILHAEAGALERPKPGDEFDLWVLKKGPRVFGIHQLTGSRMVWLALEDRLLVRDELWSLVGVGIAPFFDYGGAWYADEPARLGDVVVLWT